MIDGDDSIVAGCFGDIRGPLQSKFDRYSSPPGFLFGLSKVCFRDVDPYNAITPLSHFYGMPAVPTADIQNLFRLPQIQESFNIVNLKGRRFPIRKSNPLFKRRLSVGVFPPPTDLSPFQVPGSRLPRLSACSLP
jgi:hypothetical protein